MALNPSHFSRSIYDTCFYPESLYQSTSPYTYITNSDQIYNCNGCITTLGPRASKMGPINSIAGDGIAAAQNNIDVDSILSNRNMTISRCKNGKVNPINLTKIKSKNLPICNDYLDAQHTKMEFPSMYYRGAPINRFYDLNKDPQANIFYDWAVNTSLEAKDNYIPDPVHSLMDVSMLPVVPKGQLRADTSWDPKAIEINSNGNCGDRGRGCKLHKSKIYHNRKERIQPGKNYEIIDEMYYGRGNK
jgi:hypothetical protein